ncbi:tubulin glycylase 3A-like isoform X2 [Rhodnius prolixus]|uniref:tubulin glycylase 3A-like isoform X2 n=1 Tax=Rhodnius prolixus TaxID=13249 RepID=UPI003D18A1D1
MPEPIDSSDASSGGWQNVSEVEDDDDDEEEDDEEELEEIEEELEENTIREEVKEKEIENKVEEKAKTVLINTPNSVKGQPKKRPVSSIVTHHPAYISPERLKELKKIVDNAAQHHKTFTILGKYPSIRDALKSRGWVQNFDLQKLTLPKQRQCDDDVSVFAKLQSTDETERLVISRMLRHTTVNFIWATSENIDWNNLSKTTLVSRFPRVYFTTKVGICNYLQQSHWFFEKGIAYTRFPRCYIISSNDDVQAFVRDFRLTACMGMLKRLVNAIELGHAPIYFSDKGKIPLRTVEFAVKRCSEFVCSEEHEDIDRDTEERIWDHQWDQYLTHYYQLVHERETFVSASETQIKEMYNCSKMTLESTRKHWPQVDMDGTNNLWIVKPGAKSRGRGIVVLTKLEDILNRFTSFSSNEPRYVVQKYIEKPLLIYNTKFDIRQWFLVTCAYPLTIWMYKTIGMADRWNRVIYPGMRESITGALLTAQEHMEHRRNCFELYGADFMLTEDLVPWLIEINSSPCMSPTTSVTARMCSQCLEDVIKVVIDKKNNKDADTGMFELIYKQQVSYPQPYMGMNLTVRGCRIVRGAKSATVRNPGQEYLEKKSRDAGSPQVREAIKRLCEELSLDSSNSIPCTPLLSPASAPTPSTTSTTSGVVTLKSASSLEFDSDNKRNLKRKPYKKHCCINKANLCQAVARYKLTKNYEHISRRIRTQATNNVRCMNTVQIPQVNHLFDWKKRVEQTRADCKNMLSKFNEDKHIDHSSSKIIRANCKDKLPLVTQDKPKRKLERKSPILNKFNRLSNLPDIKSNPPKEINNNIPPLFTTCNFVKPISPHFP